MKEEQFEDEIKTLEGEHKILRDQVDKLKSKKAECEKYLKKQLYTLIEAKFKIGPFSSYSGVAQFKEKLKSEKEKLSEDNSRIQESNNVIKLLDHKIEGVQGEINRLRANYHEWKKERRTHYEVGKGFPDDRILETESTVNVCAACGKVDFFNEIGKGGNTNRDSHQKGNNVK